MRTDYVSPRWTTASPTKRGYYWLRNYQFAEQANLETKPVIASVYNSFDMPFEFCLSGNDMSWEVSELVLAEWSSEPIEPPAE